MGGEYIHIVHITLILMPDYHFQHTQVINQIAIDEEGEFLATACEDGKVSNLRYYN